MIKIKQALKKITLPALGFITFTLLFSSTANGIAKCKDQNGKWHYGDNVEHLCKTSKITKLDKRGVVKKEIAREKTKSEIEAEKKQQATIAREKADSEKLAELKKYEKKRILGSYESEADIDKVRKDKLAVFKQRKVMFDAYLGYLNKKKTRLEESKVTTKSKYARDKIDEDILKVESDIQSSKKNKENVDNSIVKVNAEFDKELELYKKYVNEEKAQKIN